jgi:ubiquinone/menaquinone biosynthesis C-methylase UbiE
VAAALDELRSRGLEPRRGRALDFGCGVGRLTQALAGHFEEVAGVDIASSMVEQARAMNAYGARCSYHLNERSDLSAFPDGHFDFIYSSITLQHMEPRYALAYIREFVRLLSDGGIVMFQLPRGPRGLRVSILSAMPRWLRRLAFRVVAGNGPVMEMHGSRRDTVERTLAGAGAVVCFVRPDHSGGPAWPGFLYVATRPGEAGTARAG